MSHSPEPEYKTKRGEIDKLLDAIRTGLDAHIKPGHSPSWGHVGDLGHWVEQLTDVSNSVNENNKCAEGPS